jgi:hypothetical protein
MVSPECFAPALRFDRQALWLESWRAAPLT